MFCWIGRNTVFEKVAFEQRPKGVGQVATERPSGWWEQWAGGLGRRYLESLRTSKASVAAKEQAGRMRWGRVADIVGRGRIPAQSWADSGSD